MATETLAEVPMVMSSDVICAFATVGAIGAMVVIRGLPFHRTTSPGINPAPLTVSAKPAPPTMALSGLRLAIVNPACCGTMVKFAKGLIGEEPPPGGGFTAVT